MRVIVVNQFLFSEDGVGNKLLRPGPDLVEIPDNLIPGLVSEGFVKVPGAASQPAKVDPPIVIKVPTAAEREAMPKTLLDEGPVLARTDAPVAKAAVADGEVEIPAEWRTSKWFTLKALATKIANREIVDSEDARRVIETELVRRAAR